MCDPQSKQVVDVQSTPPRGGRRHVLVGMGKLIVFQSTPPAWGATASSPHTKAVSCVSIHAPRVGGDRSLMGDNTHRTSFNPRPPRGGRPDFDQVYAYFTYRFNPRPPRGGRPPHIGRIEAHRIVSIHAPRVGGDTHPVRPSDPNLKPFQSTPPAWGATAVSRDWM